MSSNEIKRYTITAALPYANGPKHIGHLAGAYLPADIYVKYLKAQQKDVVFACGSDEHGAAITMKAIKENTTPQAIVDKYHALLKENMHDLNIDFDIYHRTSEKLHHETAQEFFTNLNNNGDLEILESEQYFDEIHQQFLADRYIKGTCPICSHTEAYGDQCEKCGSSLSPEQLINPISTLSTAKPILRKTKHWYLPLNKHEEFLKEWLLNKNQSENWRNNVIGQCKSWIDAGLQPRAVTRDLDWGIKVPISPEGDGKVLYVWFDAPIGYISATKEWALQNNKDWKPYWYNNYTKLVHFIGKDNIVFHCIIFPIMLKLNGNIIPTNVPANEFMNLEGDKMSTSRGWSIEMDDYIKDFVKKDNGGGQTVDMLRYYLNAISPETKDSEFIWKGFQDAVNSELVSIFGNFINRALVLMHKLCNGKVPPLHQDILDEKDKQIIEDIKLVKEKITDLLENYQFRDAQFLMIDLARKGNKYMQEKEPWIVAKSIAEKQNAQKSIDNCLHICLQLTANLAILSHPFLPNTAKKICYLLKVVDKILLWENAGKINLLKVGYSLRAPELLFRKIEDEEIRAQVEKLHTKKMEIEKNNISIEINNEVKITPVKPIIEFDDFTKIDLRIGTIINAEKVKGADKLLKLEVDLGFEIRTIVSGIALHFETENIIGKQVTVVCNLAPRKMRGVESNGMILMAEDENGKLILLNSNETSSNGSLIT